jgi:hypothetical protein
MSKMVSELIAPVSSVNYLGSSGTGILSVQNTSTVKSQDCLSANEIFDIFAQGLIKVRIPVSTLDLRPATKRTRRLCPFH